MRENRYILIGALLGCGPWLLLMLIFFGWVISRTVTDRGARVGVIRITGPITAGGGGLFLGGTSSETTIRQLRAAGEDRNIRAVLLRINSPGGSAAASQEIYQEVRRLRTDKGKKVIVSMGDVAASGGYYIAAGADSIVANGSTITGSIGVIMQMPELVGLMEQHGIDINVIKSGPYKDIGNPARELMPQERELLTTMVQDVFDQFVTAVADGRKMPREKVSELADGRILTGRQAQKLGLVDRLGNWRDAVLLAGREAGIRDEPRLREFRDRGRLSPFFGDPGPSSARIPAEMLLLDWRLISMAKEMLKGW
jgi:protease IV